LRQSIPRLSDKMLTQCLQGLQDRGLVSREPTAGSAVRYELTTTGRSLQPVLQQLYEWGDAQVDRLGVKILDRERSSDEA